MELSLATRSVSDHMVLEIGGEIDVYTAPRLRERLIEMVNSGEKHVVVDLGRAEFLDSTGLGVRWSVHTVDCGRTAGRSTSSARTSGF
jgi:anti-sigma B factor antagonist